MVPEKRVCRVSCELDDGQVRKGTGLLVAPDIVLTAAHCVPGRSVKTSFGWGRVIWRTRRAVGMVKPDAALIRLDNPTTVPGALRWGRVVGGTPLVAHAIGFPRVSHPGAHHLRAELRPDFTLAPATAPPQEDDWRGFSGSALFAEGLLVGVVTHTPERWENRELLAVPVATLMRDPMFARYVGAPVLREVELERLRVPDVIARSPAMLLRADVEATSFQPGREDVLAALDHWCGTDRPQDAMLITGPGGQGKSRLGLEFGHRMRAKGWAVLHLRDDAPDLAPLTGVREPLLVVVDYAERRDLSKLAEALPEHVRVLMLARQDDGWREHLGPHASLLSAAGHIALPALFADPDRLNLAELTAELTTEYARGLHDLGLTPRGTVEPPWEARTALGVHMHVLASLLDDGDEPAQGRVLDHEARYWTATAHRHGLDLSSDTMRTAVAVASATPAKDRAEALAALALVPGVRDLGEDARFRAAEWLRGLYPGGDRWWGTLQPDRLAEWLYAERRRAWPEVMSEAYRLALRQGGILDRLGLVLDLSDAEAIGAGEAIAALRDLADQADLELAGAVLTRLAAQLVAAGRYEEAVRVRRELTEVARATATDDGLRQRLLTELIALACLADPDAATQARFRTWSPSLQALVFRELRYYEYQRYSKDFPDPITPERRALAVPALMEALAIATEQYRGGPTDHGRLGALLFWIMDTGDPAEIIEANRLLADAHRRLENDPDQARYLTNTLASLGVALANAGRFEESLDAFEEAVERYSRPGAPDRELGEQAVRDRDRLIAILGHENSEGDEVVDTS